MKRFIKLHVDKYSITYVNKYSIIAFSKNVNRASTGIQLDPVNKETWDLEVIESPEEIIKLMK